VSSPQDLADTLVEVLVPEYPRFVAHWMTHASHLDAPAALSGDAVVDALVAAAAAHVVFKATGQVPGWTEEPERSLSTLWYSGPDAFFANALVHTPLVFRLHGVLIEADSLASV